MGDDTTRQIPAPNTTPVVLPDFGLPSFNWELPEVLSSDAGLAVTAVNPADLLPPPGKVVEAGAAGGQELLVWHATRLFFLRNVITLNTPRATDITPSSLGNYAIKQVVVDPFSNFTTAVGAYVLAYDSGNGVSAVWYTANAAALVPIWTKGADASGQYNVLRAGNVAGAVLIYGSQVTLPQSNCYPRYYNFRTSMADWTFDIGHQVVGEGAWSDSDGFEQMVTVKLTCTEALDPNSHVHVYWYRDQVMAPSNCNTVHWYDAGDNELRWQGAGIYTAGEHDYTYDTNGTSGAVTLRVRIYSANITDYVIIRSVEILAP